MLENMLKEIPDVLTVKEVAELTGYNRKTILRYAKKKYIFAINLKGKLCISKQSLIEYLSSNKALGNTQKSEWYEKIILLFIK
jgi:excisionase family DNA binding protein